MRRARAGQTFPPTPRPMPPNMLSFLPSAVAQVESRYFLYVVPLAGGAVLGCVVIALVLTWRWRAKPHSVIPFPLAIRVGRVALLLLEFAVMAGAIAVIAIGAVSYSNLSVYGKGLALGSFLVASFMYVFAFIGFMGAWKRSRPALALAAVLTMLLFCVFVGLLAAVFWLNANLGNDAIVAELQAAWKAQVAVLSIECTPKDPLKPEHQLLGNCCCWPTFVGWASIPIPPGENFRKGQIRCGPIWKP